MAKAIGGVALIYPRMGENLFPLAVDGSLNGHETFMFHGHFCFLHKTYMISLPFLIWSLSMLIQKRQLKGLQIVRLFHLKTADI